jgi:hypothetical protein
MRSELPARYAAVDVYYPPDGGAVAAAVICSDARYAGSSRLTGVCA